MRLHKLAPLAALLLAGTCLSTAAAGQVTQPSPGRATPAMEHSPEGPVVNVNFRGGTVDQYVSAIRKEAGAEPVNIAVSAKAGALQMPPTELTSVTVYTAVSAIGSAVEPPGSYYWAIRPLESGGGGATAFAIGLQYSGAPLGQTSDDPVSRAVLQVFDARDFIGASSPDSPKASIDATLTAIDAAVGMLAEPGDEPPQIKFHKDTSLLIVRGTPRQVEMIRSVVRELASGLKREEAGLRAARAEEVARTIARKRAQINANIADTRMLQAKARIDHLRSLADSGNVSADEVRAAETQLAEMQAQRELADLDAQAAEMAGGGRISDPDARADANATLNDLSRRVKELEVENAGLRARIQQLTPQPAPGGGKKRQ